MQNIIKVGMADINVLEHPGILTTLGLGSCVGIALFDNRKRIIGLAHIMLPSSKYARSKTNVAKFADTAVVSLLNKMEGKGAKRNSIIAKLAGGAQMFSFSNSSDMMRIGERNIISAKAKLKELKIPVISQHTGGNYGRTIELHSKDGLLLIKTIGHGIFRI